MSQIDYKNKETIIFDLDGTLALSKSAIDEEMHTLLESLLDKKKVLVMSGGRWKQFEKQLLSHLSLTPERLSKIFISPGSGSGLYRFDNGEVREVYADFLSKDEKQRIKEAYEYALPKSGIDLPKETYGETLEDRGTQMTYSALGQNAPLEIKEKWDPDHKKRESIVSLLIEKIPDLDVHIGGTTSIDITKKGEGKDFGIREFSKHIGTPIEKMVYIGDALYPGGNDEPARATGVDCIQVKDVDETKRVIREIISA